MRAIGVRSGALALCVLLAACHGAKPDGGHGGATAKLVAEDARAAPEPAPIPGNNIAVKSDLLDFRYAWPELPGDARPLATWLAKDAAKERTRAEGTAKDDAAAAKDTGDPFDRHSDAKAWTVAGTTAALLSLSATLAEFTGGAHPNSGFEALLWDRAARKPLAFPALLADRAAGLAAIAARFCPALDAERARRRGAGPQGLDRRIRYLPRARRRDHRAGRRRRRRVHPAARADRPL